MSGYGKGCGGQVCYCGEELIKVKKPASNIIDVQRSASKFWARIETGEREIFINAEFLRDLQIQYGVHINEKYVKADE